MDLGLKVFAVLSTGERIESPDYTRLNRRLRRAQRVLSHRQKGSEQRERARLQVAKKVKISDLRKVFLHKLSARLVKDYAVVCLEELNVSGIVKNRKLARAYQRSGLAGAANDARSKICHLRQRNARPQPLGTN